MKKNRFLSLVVSASLVFSAISASVFALTFDDVENDPTVAWAKDSITKMTDAGYIKGYDDNTFKPSRAISKVECLLLMSRMLGVEEREYKDSVAAAVEIYGDTVKKFNSTYVNELSFLLYCDILRESDLQEYISAANANSPLMRYQAAVLMTKLMGYEDEVKDNVVNNSVYSDASSIPAAARPFVEFVTNQKVMNGMGNDAAGKPVFSPNTSLTRAQVATLLARMIDTLGKTTKSGTVTDVQNSGKKFEMTVGDTAETVSVANNSVIKVDGVDGTYKNIQEDAAVKITYICNLPRLIELSAPTKSETVYGMITAVNESSEGKRFTLADSEDASVKASYYADDACVYTRNGSGKAAFADMVNDTFVSATIRNGKIVAMNIEEKNSELTGDLVDVDYDDEDNIYLTIADTKTKKEQTYPVSTKGAAVTRDGSKANYRELASGDHLTVKLTYGKITSISAKSSSEKVEGVITEVILSNSPSLTIKADGKEKTYKLYSDAQIRINDEEGTIYDLRPGYSVSATLQSSEISKVSVSSVPTNEDGQVEGTVTGLNTSYYVITIEDTNGDKQSVYYNTKTTFLKRDGTPTNAKAIEKGMKVTVTGTMKNGVFEATIVIIQ